MEKVDINRLRDCSKDLNSLINNLNEYINGLYTRISNMSSKTLEWVGSSSEDFIRRANLEKEQYYKTIETLKKYSNFLESVSNKYEADIKKLG